MENTNAPFSKSAIALIIQQEKFIYLKQHANDLTDNDKLIDIQCRYVKKTILDDYCDYVICCLSALQNNQDEARQFHKNARFRSRTYQLYIMMESLFGSLISNMTIFEKSIYQKILSRIDNNIVMFFDNKKLFIPADNLDDLMMRFIKSRTHEMIQTLHTHNTVTISTRSFHVADTLSIEVDKTQYENAVTRIKMTYKDPCI